MHATLATGRPLFLIHSGREHETAPIAVMMNDYCRCSFNCFSLQREVDLQLDHKIVLYGPYCMKSSSIATTSYGTKHALM